MPWRQWIGRAAAIGLLLGLAACGDSVKTGTPLDEDLKTPGSVLDEARQAGREAASFPHAASDYFHEMDNGIVLNEREAAGRNMWLVWSGGNDRFWDHMSVETFGAFDLLKIVSSYPAGDPRNPNPNIGRATRWKYLGLVNEPCFDAPTKPDAYGLWLDVRRSDGAECKPDPFADAAAYPGVKLGQRGKVFPAGTTFANGQPAPASLPVGSYYGEPSGVMGLRLFPNPKFNAEAAKKWDPVRYYTDPKYYNDPNLVRPYRVGMSCGFCHVGPSPIHPPADPENPKFSELNSTVGAQYMWVDRLFIFSADEKNYMYQIVHTYRPGAMDTSLVSTDMINNPRTMNAIYNLDDRMKVALHNGREVIKGGELNNKQFGSYTGDAFLGSFDKGGGDIRSPRVLKDASDAVGALGALNRVYLNIGLFSEEWLLHFRAVSGGKTITPIPIATAERNSAYWQATEAGTPSTALFFLKAGRPDHLKDAPGGAAHLNDPPATVARGKQVFAETCARCHSSKLPPEAVAELDKPECVGKGYMKCFQAYWRRSQTPQFKAEMRQIVEAPDFLDHNYLSGEFRVPVTLLRTNACSPLATNALRGNIWNDFSSEGYKSLPSVGAITVANPFDGTFKAYKMPAGGRGYTRPPSLISLWSSAPYLLNNTVGDRSRTEYWTENPDVATRMAGFQTGVEQMLWPEKRDGDKILGFKAHGVIDRTTDRSWLVVDQAYLPAIVRNMTWLIKLWDRDIFYDPAHPPPNGPPALRHTRKDSILLGPIPKDMPVSLLANTKLRAETRNPFAAVANAWRLVQVAHRLKLDRRAIQGNETDAQLRERYANVRAPLLSLSKCPDYVVNKGHLFGTAFFNQTEGLTADERSWGTEPVLNDDDKRALIAFLKTF